MMSYRNGWPTSNDGSRRQLTGSEITETPDAISGIQDEKSKMPVCSLMRIPFSGTGGTGNCEKPVVSALTRRPVGVPNDKLRPSQPREASGVSCTLSTGAIRLERAFEIASD